MAKILPLYLVVVLNILAENSIYGVKIDKTDIETERKYFQDISSNVRHVLNIREKRGLPEEYRHDRNLNNNWRNKYVWNKIRNINEQNNRDGGTSNNGIGRNRFNNVPEYKSNGLPGYRTNSGRWRPGLHNTNMPRFNSAGFNPASFKDNTRPTVQHESYNSIPINKSTPKYGITTPKYGVTTPRSAVTTPITTTKNPNGNIKNKRKKKKIPACVFCVNSCKAGEHEDNGFCVPDNSDY